ncbi:hypothetical protein TNCV_2712361 [Trichonephila clavipes]|nr:hypothetical protein TNCV_2712361 [Trichonephila clavipes]
MELEVNATSLNVSDEDLFENVVELPPIPNRALSQSELPQGIRVFTSTPVSTSTPPVTTSTPPVTTSTPRVSTSTPRAQKRKVESSQEAFYENANTLPPRPVDEGESHSLKTSSLSRG